jgi:ABC-type lipoprotein release transport system permease subunit
MMFSNVILVFMISLQLGMYQLMIDNTLRAFTGHLQIQVPGYKDEQKIRQTVPHVQTLAADMRDALGIDSVAARAVAFALASSADRSYGIQVIGVQPDFEPEVSSIPGLVGQGRYLRGSSAEIVIGKVLARNLRVEIGDELTLLGSGRDGSFAAAVVNVVGIFDSGMPDIDRSFAEIPLRFFQDTFSMGDSGHSVVIAAPDLFEVAAFKHNTTRLLPADVPLVVHDWDALQPGLKQAIQADLASAWFMYGVLVILVAFSVLNTQLMSVLERTKEFGIVMALGLGPGRLGRLVVLETILMGLMGLGLGVLMGGLVTLWFSYHGFTYPGLDEMAIKFNLPDRIYPDVTLVSLFWGPIVVFIGSLLAALYPALRLYWLQPVAAMRAA